MAQQLLIKIVDNDTCDEDRTPFLMLWQLWGGYTMPALKAVRGILELLGMFRERISSVMRKPNHKDELADLLTYLMNLHCRLWMPYCPKEVEGLGYTMEEDRESFWKLTKVVLIANGLPHSAALINKETIWNPEGLLIATGETIGVKVRDSEIRTDISVVEIGLDSDASPRIAFGVMDAFEPAEGVIEKGYEGSHDVLIYKDSLKKYCGEMSIATWKEFERLLDIANTRGYSFLVNKEENLILEIKD